MAGWCVQRARHGWLLLSTGDCRAVGAKGRSQQAVEGLDVSPDKPTSGPAPTQGSVTKGWDVCQPRIHSSLWSLGRLLSPWEVHPILRAVLST